MSDKLNVAPLCNELRNNDIKIINELDKIYTFLERDKD